MYLLAIALISTTTIFAIFYLRLRRNRFVHSIYLHSFMLQSMSYFTMYLESLFGIVFSCFFYYENIHINRNSKYFLNLCFISVSSSTFIIRVLRQYRIYISTYIEMGTLAYKKTIIMKKRLKNSWNLKVAFLFLGTLWLFMVIATIIHAQFYKYHSENAFAQYLMIFIRGGQLITEFYCFYRFMKANIKLAYRIEVGILVCFQVFTILFVSVLGIETYLRYGVVSMQKLCTVIFFDTYILRVLTKDSEKKPLLPPIYMIDSSFYITEIKIVYDCFVDFIEIQGNKEWRNLVDILMQIHMSKQNRSKLLGVSCHFHLQQLQVINSELSEKMQSVINIDRDEVADKLEMFIIELLDTEAFKSFMSSGHYELLKSDFSNEVRL